MEIEGEWDISDKRFVELLLLRQIKEVVRSGEINERRAKQRVNDHICVH